MRRVALFTVFAAVCLLALPSFAATRGITVALRDSYGDGWNGASLTIRVNGTALASPTVSSGSSTNTYTFTRNIGDSVSFSWTSGNYNSECAFAVYYTDDPPSTTFNPASGATNDVGRLLVYRLYTSLGSTANGAFLGSFKVVLPPEIIVSPKDVLLSAGETQAFTVTFISIAAAAQAVTWSVSGNNDEATVISEDGVLTLSDDETAFRLTVKAILNSNTKLYDTALVNIPYLIGTAAEFAEFAELVNEGNDFNRRTVKLTADLDLSDYGAEYNDGKGWVPVGTAASPFRGNFDGAGHVVRGLFIDGGIAGAGLFGYIGGNASGAGSVKNLGVEGAEVKGASNVGGIAGSVSGYSSSNLAVIENCYVSGTITAGTGYVGGIVGISEAGRIGNCYSTAAVAATAASSNYVGGIAGYSYANAAVLYCAALNSSVSGAGSDVKRVAGSAALSTFSGNVAYPGMLNGAGTDVWGGGALDGEDIYGHEIYADGTLGGRFAAEPWVTADGYLPAFGAAAAMPAHIKNIPPVVTGVLMNRGDTVLIRGVSASLQFSASVLGTNRPSQAVVWSVVPSAAGITISAGGLLSVTAAAVEAVVTVKAASAADASKYAAVIVTVLDTSGGSVSGNQSVVERYGRLSVKGNRLCNERGDTVQLRGMSFFWSMAGEGRNYYNADAVNWLADDWKVNVVRAAMGVDEDWGTDASGYLAGDNSGGVSNKKRVTDVVDAAIAKGIYAIIDWHSHSAHSNTAAAKTFFEEMAAKYKDVPNVIYEIYNEPESYPWATVKTYSQTIVNAIRAIDPNGIIIIGTPTWSQDVDVATESPVVGENLAYSLHFYAYAHGASLRSKATTALNRNKALFVSEFGTCNYDGDTPIDTASTTTWLNFLGQSKTSWVNWSICNKAEAASVLKAGTTKYTGNWLTSDLTLSGTYIRNKLIAAAASEAQAAPTVTLCALKYKAGENGRLRVNDASALVDSLSTKAAKGKSGPTVEAVPNGGYVFANWSDGKTAAERKDTSVAALTVSAVFVPDTYYKLSYTAGTGGTVTGPAIQWAAPGSNGDTVQAVQSSGYVFIGWSDGVTTAKRADVNVTKDIAVTAQFAKLYTLTYSAGTGGKVLIEVSQTVAHGSDGEAVLALPDSGYAFVGWSDGVTEAARTDTNVTANVAATAQFARVYTLAYSAGTGGKIVGDTLQKVIHGSDASAVIALPDSGYAFVMWSDSAKASERADTNVTQDIAVSAVFARTAYTLTYVVSPKYGRLIGKALQSVKPGENGAEVYAFDTAQGYKFTAWSDGTTANPRQDKNVSSDITVTAYFTDGNGNLVSVLAPNREIPQNPPKEEATVIAPTVILAGEFTAGPNPVSKQSGGINFYRQGRRINNCELRIYDATGNHIKKIKIKDNAIGTQAKRIVGSWDLTDRKGRTVSDGTYLVKGVLKTSDGKVEKVSVILSVR